ncbi:beta-N-acetylhexosaminidase [Photobacterium minamisatsumaniensis]|uniref:beta-N-acetylhexosaminidase n=1 Tax=Photobacterium minamisatsumaniensis TaxID=2910233 RepID=UPI003D0A1FF2
MKKKILSALVMGAILSPAVLAGAPNTDLNLMPYPHSVELSEGRVNIDHNFNIYLKGFSSERVDFTAKRLLKRLERQTGVPMLSPTAESEADAVLVIDIKQPAKTEVQSIDADESYTLTAKDGKIVLTSERPYGAIRGIETLLQLVATDSKGNFVPEVSIEDEPRFPWRGVSYDTSRHFIEVDVIKRQLDAMASAKLNIFHWHIWDDQAIRIQLDSYPKLWQKTADGDYYSKDEIRDVVEYARNLGIRVIPEISLPGHASAVAHAYPELMSGGEGQAYPHQREWGVFVPLMDPTNPELYTFLGKVFDEVVALFPDEYFHIGGDEPNYAQWTDSEEIQQFIADKKLDGNRGLQSYLNTQVEKMLDERGKKVMGWDEIWHKDLPKSVVIQSWRGHDSIGRAAKEGYQGILSTGYYLDQPQPTSYHYRNDPMPTGITVDDKLHAGEKFAAYEWSKPRTKGGPRSGLITIIEGTDGEFRAFTDYNGKSREEVYILEYVPGKVFRGHFDNFMSYTEFNLAFEGDELAQESYQLIGNVRWPTTGKLIAGTALEGSEIPAPDGGYPAELTKDEQSLILGGEITVWAENLDSMTVENRIWPRSYAIAERFWSSESLTDEDSMYKRMKAVDTWSEISMGLQHHFNADIMYKRIANGADAQPLIILARYTEPAQYYARNWEKWIQTPNHGDLYNQHERLNRFVDALPVESYAVYDMEANVKLVANGDKQALATLKTHYETVLAAAKASAPIFANNIASVDTVIVAEKTVEVANIALQLIALHEVNRQPTEEEHKAFSQQLSDAAKIYDEAIVAIVKPTEMLLNLGR